MDNQYVTLREYHDEYWWPLTQKRLRECTLVSYESAWRLHIEPKLGDILLCELTTQDIELWLASFDSEGVARRSYAVLRIILRSAERYEMIAQDPTRKVLHPPSKPHYEPDTLSKDEVFEMIRAFHGHPLEALITINVSCGLRKEEGLALLWEDINLETGETRISKGLQWVNGHECLNPPKTKSSNRLVYIPEIFLPRLREIASTGRIIGNIEVSKAGQMYKKHCDECGIHYVPLKNLRTTWATVSLASGMPIQVVSHGLGHSEVTTTAQYYLGFDIKALEQGQHHWNIILNNEDENEQVSWFNRLCHKIVSIFRGIFSKEL